MQLEATEKPIKYRLKTGEEVTLRPGVPTELPDQAATQLLKKAPDKVRLVDCRSAIHPADVLIECASPNAHPVYWQSMDGRILGPAKPEFLARVGAVDGATFWVIVTYCGGIRWIRSDRLRSRQAFEAQRKH